MMADDTASISDTPNPTHAQDATAATTIMSPSSDSTTTAPPTTLAWDATDITSLAPTSLPLAKAQRAWDRRPTSPFSRRRFKVGKIFKRNNNFAPSGGFHVHIRETAHGTPVKAVKKLRISRESPGGGAVMGSVVADWERGGSPANRRIVTRSSMRREELIALDEEEYGDHDGAEADVEDDGEDVVEEDVEGTTVEILNEDGSQRNDAPETLAAEEWEYESATEVDEDEEAAEAAWERCRQDARAERENRGEENTTLSYSGPDGVVQLVHTVHQQVKAGPVLQDESEHPAAASATPQKEAPIPPPTVTTEERISDQAVSAPKTIDYPELRAAIHHPIPDGFVSPVKGGRRRPISQARQANANRRRTLPTDFAAKAAKQATDETQSQPQESEELSQFEDTGSGEPRFHEHYTLHDSLQESTGVQSVTHSKNEEMRDDDSWEDIEPETALRDYTPEHEEIPTEPNTPETESFLVARARAQVTAQPQQVTALLSPSKILSSPVPTIEGSHPRLPLRRSPRRQSTSPMKYRSILKQSTTKPHLVAFTPVKMPAQRQFESGSNFASSPLPILFAGIASPSLDGQDLPQLTRSSSAPPEEPQMSPRKPKQPRISDDTALLEAFLKRASESRSGQRVSDVAKRESLENRRESGTVRQALASPLLPRPTPLPSKADVLSDLDPNSPSPRKPSGVTFSTQKVESKDSHEYAKDPIQDDEDELAIESGPPRRSSSRRSGRVKNSSETLPASAYSGKQKIHIKTGADGVILKKTEAQQLAIETKKNTTSNKQGAVGPALRLTRMAAEQKTSQEPDEDAMDVERVLQPGKKGVRWNETLVSFYQGDDAQEVSTMADELGDDQENNTLDESEMSSVPFKKPKLRKLKPSKPTASMPAKPAVHMEESEPAAETKPKPKMKKKVSRIATPAKAKGQTLLGQPVDEGEDVSTIKMEHKPSATSTTKKSAVVTLKVPDGGSSIAAPSSKRSTSSTTAKKVIPSKLPAPASTVASTTAPKASTTSIVAPSGQENSITASPPKKRTTKTAAIAAAPLKLGEAKGLAPKFDLSKATPLKPNGNDGNSIPGLMSPAKKAPRLGAATTRHAKVEDREDVSAAAAGAAGMGSPAKKRTRRMLSR